MLRFLFSKAGPSPSWVLSASLSCGGGTGCKPVLGDRWYHGHEDKTEEERHMERRRAVRNVGLVPLTQQPSFWNSQARYKIVEFLHVLDIYWTTSTWFTFRYQITHSRSTTWCARNCPHSQQLGLNLVNSNNLPNSLATVILSWMGKSLAQANQCIDPPGYPGAGAGHVTYTDPIRMTQYSFWKYWAIDFSSSDCFDIRHSLEQLLLWMEPHEDKATQAGSGNHSPGSCQNAGPSENWEHKWCLRAVLPLHCPVTWASKFFFVI